MDQHEATENLATIRRIMESATQLTTLPGKAAICGGVLALAGCAVTFWQMRSMDFGAVAKLPEGTRATIIATWAVVAVATILIDIAMTVRLARRKGMNPWSRLSQLAAYAMGPGIAAATLLMVAFVARGEWQLVAPVWMMLYGTAVWMAGILSVRAPRTLGLVFFIAGALTLFWLTPWAVAMVALTFGAAHVAYGIYLIRRFGD